MPSGSVYIIRKDPEDLSRCGSAHAVFPEAGPAYVFLQQMPVSRPGAVKFFAGNIFSLSCPEGRKCKAVAPARPEACCACPCRNRRTGPMLVKKQTI